ncbi:MAG: flagellar biosynthetic protein FliR [Vicinamibacterales bacterium]
MIDLTPLIRFGLLLVRPGMLVMVAPAFGGLYTPPQVKVGLTVLMAIGLLPSVQVPPAGGDVGLAVMVTREMAIGMSLALVARALVASAEFAGHLSGFQMGFSYGATVDPSTGVRNTMIASLYGLLSVLTFLAVNGHHALLRALAESYAGLPIGAGELHDSILSAVSRILALVFTVGVRLAAPIIVVLLIVELAIGLIARTAPSLSMMVIGYPLRIVIGLAVLAALVSTIPGVIGSMVDRVIGLALETAAAFR